jgi:hypothetical protein
LQSSNTEGFDTSILDFLIVKNTKCLLLECTSSSILVRFIIEKIKLPLASSCFKRARISSDVEENYCQDAREYNGFVAEFFFSLLPQAETFCSVAR